MQSECPIDRDTGGPAVRYPSTDLATLGNRTHFIDVGDIIKLTLLGGWMDGVGICYCCCCQRRFRIELNVALLAYRNDLDAMKTALFNDADGCLRTPQNKIHG